IRGGTDRSCTGEIRLRSGAVREADCRTRRQVLKAIIERRLVYSPVNGVVTKLELHAGEYADPASPIAMIAENRPLLVEIYLPVEVYPDVKSGMPVVIKPRQPIGGVYSANIANKDPIIDSASGTFQVTAYLANEDASIPAGVRCGVEFPAP